MVQQATSLQKSGFQYLAEGGKWVLAPGIRRFVILPLALNILLLGSAFWWLFSRLNDWIPAVMRYVPDTLQWLNYLLWPLAVISVVLVFSYFFSTVANWLAAPFCGLLSEQLEARLTGTPPPDTGIAEIIADTPRIMKREWQKFIWYLPRAIGLLLLYFIPGIGQTVAPILWFLFSAWMLAIQYCDYPFDNHKVPFVTMRAALRCQKSVNLQFGALVSLLTMIPLLNLVIMPVAVCGATIMWVEAYHADYGRKEKQ